MQIWLELFCIVAAVAMVVQVVIWTMLFFQNPHNERERGMPGGAIDSRVGPILTGAQILRTIHSRNLQHGERCIAYRVHGRGQAQEKSIRGLRTHADPASRQCACGPASGPEARGVEDAGAKFSKQFLATPTCAESIGRWCRNLNGG